MPSAKCLVPIFLSNGRNRIRTCEGISQRVYSPSRLTTPAPALYSGLLYGPGHLASSLKPHPSSLLKATGGIRTLNLRFTKPNQTLDPKPESGVFIPPIHFGPIQAQLQTSQIRAVET